MRGSGKSTIGKLLAKRLGKTFVETDELVVTDIGMPIREIVNKFGWNKFRESESKIMIDLALTGTNDVIVTGGGVVENKQNIAKFNSNNDVIIWLRCLVDTIIKRIGSDKSRPMIANSDNFKDDLRKVYKTRKSLYRKYADIIISSDEDAAIVVNKIIDKLKERNLL